MFSGVGLRRVLIGAVVLIGVGHTVSGSSISRLRARQSRQQQKKTQNDNGEGSGFEAGGGSLKFEHGRRLSNGGDGGVPVHGQGRFGQPKLGRSLKSTRDPQCNLPEAFSCTLNTTAIGMIESGFATYYDDTCEATGAEGCYTDGIAACRTCYLSTEVYIAANANATVNNIPNWAMCPCCVPTTLEDNHFDIEVMAFDYSVFNISDVVCTDAPTPAPAPTGAVTTTSPAAAAPTAAAPTVPSPSAAPATAEQPVLAAATVAPGVGATPAPEAASRALDSPAPSEATTTDSTTMTSIEATPAPSSRASSTSDADGDDADGDDAANEAGTENLDTSDGDDGLSMGAKVGIGAGAAVGVIIVGAAGFGIMKARRGA